MLGWEQGEGGSVWNAILLRFGVVLAVVLWPVTLCLLLVAASIYLSSLANSGERDSRPP